jgi:hypothetical protein
MRRRQETFNSEGEVFGVKSKHSTFGVGDSGTRVVAGDAPGGWDCLGGFWQYAAVALPVPLMANAHGVKSLDHYHNTAGWSILLFTASVVALLAWALTKFESSLRTPRPDSVKPVS